MSVQTNNFCCRMRAKFAIGIVGVDNRVDVPDIDMVDHVIDWEGERPLIGIAFCPFCGKKIDRSKDTLRDTRDLT